MDTLLRLKAWLLATFPTRRRGLSKELGESYSFRQVNCYGFLRSGSWCGFQVVLAASPVGGTRQNYVYPRKLTQPSATDHVRRLRAVFSCKPGPCGGSQAFHLVNGSLSGSRDLLLFVVLRQIFKRSELTNRRSTTDGTVLSEFVSERKHEQSLKHPCFWDSRKVMRQLGQRRSLGHIWIAFLSAEATKVLSSEVKT